MMTPGELTDLVVFERKTTSTTTPGSVSTQTTWTQHLTTWAKVKTLSGSDQTKEGKTVSERKIRVWILYRTDKTIRVGDRITWRNTTWLVESPPVPDIKRFFFEFDAVIDFIET